MKKITTFSGNLFWFSLILRLTGKNRSKSNLLFGYRFDKLDEKVVNYKYNWLLVMFEIGISDEDL